MLLYAETFAQLLGNCRENRMVHNAEPNGAGACELLRRFPGLPILFTSGFSENANSAMAQVPASHYLQKPYSRTSLASTISEILDHPGKHAQPGTSGELLG